MHWSRHWKVQHPEKKKEDRIALIEGKEPEEPWCSNWREVIDDGAAPKEILPQYLKSYRCINKRHKVGQSEATPSVAGDFGELK